jgi:hypothetical protein
MYVLILTKMGWAIFWAIFSQTYLVTLAPIWSPWLSSGHPGSHLVTMANTYF